MMPLVSQIKNQLRASQGETQLDEQVTPLRCPGIDCSDQADHPLGHGSVTATTS